MIYDYVLSLLEGIDLERYDALPVILTAFIVVLSVAYAFRGLFALFNSFWR